MKIDALTMSGACFLFTVYACSSDAPATAPPASSSIPDAGTSPTNEQEHDDGGVASDDAGADGAADADAGPRPKPVFLDAAEYADLLTIDAKFPFGVTQKHAANADISITHWGRHGGPMVTLDDAVVKWSFPAGATADATMTSQTFVKATGLPDEFFYGGDGMVDLGIGSLSMLSYSGPDSPFAGEALIYDATYRTVKSRAKANGFYSGVGISDGATGWLVYSGLSALAAEDSDTNDSGLYVAGICGEKLLAPPPCPASRKLFGWTGYSGPVVTDAHGNTFVAAAINGGDTSDVVYGLGKKEITGGATVDKHVIIAIDSGGTASFTAIAPENGEAGWVLGLGFGETSPIYAAPYVENSGAVAKSNEVVASAITRGTGVDAISLFTDNEGDLWLAIVQGDKGTFLELRRK